MEINNEIVASGFTFWEDENPKSKKYIWAKYICPFLSRVMTAQRKISMESDFILETNVIPY